MEYILVEKKRTEFQKLLNQWKHQYEFEIVWMSFDIIDDVYRALIKRTRLEQQ